jgi:hypothetical protein
MVRKSLQVVWGRGIVFRRRLGAPMHARRVACAWLGGWLHARAGKWAEVRAGEWAGARKAERVLASAALRAGPGRALRGWRWAGMVGEGESAS